MNQAQEYRDRFPGIEVKDDPAMSRRTRSFSSYQKERTIIECMEDALWDLDIWDCECVVFQTGEHWWNTHRYYTRDAIVSTLFDQSLKGYVTKFVIELKAHDRFVVWLKIHELTPGLDTNIGPNLVEYIGDMVSE